MGTDILFDADSSMHLDVLATGSSELALVKTPFGTGCGYAPMTRAAHCRGQAVENLDLFEAHRTFFAFSLDSPYRARC